MSLRRPGFWILLGMVGAALVWVLLLKPPASAPPPSLEKAALEKPSTPSPPHGPRGGWLFAEDSFRLELKIYEQGVPPRFRAYVTDDRGHPLDLSQVHLTAELHRLDRVDRIGFKPAGEYLRGDAVVEEPHSFEVVLKARWKDQTFQWNFSQIEGRAELSPEVAREAGIETATAGPATLKNTLTLNGEIGLNEEKVTHIVPRLDGVVREVHTDLGDQVTDRELLAVLESRELADAKTGYLHAVNQYRLAQADLEIQKEIFQNTQLMLDLLEKESDLDAVLDKLKDRVIGENRAQTITAFAKLKLAETVFQREKGLYEKKISSAAEYQAALEDYKSAEAKYLSLREKIATQGRLDLMEKKRKAQTATLHLQTRRQKLLTLGLSGSQVESLTFENEPDFTLYELRSPIAGTVIQKHITTGEAVKKDDGIFVLADLSNVWVNISIPEKDLSSVHLGQKITVRAQNGDLESEGTLTYLGSLIDEKTRTVNGRGVLPNAERKWRPGGFVTAELVLKERRVPVAVPPQAIQSLRDWSVVFVRYGNHYEARPLELGETTGDWVEVLQGLRPGERYVVKNSFVIKAELGKSGATHHH